MSWPVKKVLKTKHFFNSINCHFLLSNQLKSFCGSYTALCELTRGFLGFSSVRSTSKETQRLAFTRQQDSSPTCTSLACAFIQFILTSSSVSFLASRSRRTLTRSSRQTDNCIFQWKCEFAPCVPCRNTGRNNFRVRCRLVNSDVQRCPNSL